MSHGEDDPRDERALASLKYIDLNDPKWGEAGLVHDWRNHVHDRVRALWDTFTEEQREAIAIAAIEAAQDEDWE